MAAGVAWLFQNCRKNYGLLPFNIELMDDRSNTADEWNAAVRSLLFVNAVLLKEITFSIQNRVLVYERRWSTGVIVGVESWNVHTGESRGKVEGRGL